MALPVVTIAVPTYNSAATLATTLRSLRRQDYPQSKLEILVIDGGSTDQTLTIARRAHAKILPNPQTELVYAKQIAYLQAKGRYLIYLDSDESLVNPKTIRQRQATFAANPQVKAILTSGYTAPAHTHPLNHYINEFGDPFSFYYYRQSKGYGHLIPDLQKTYPAIVNSSNFVIFDYQNQPLPLFELWAGGCMIDLDYCRQQFKSLNRHPYLLAQLFYLINSRQQQLAIMKHQPTLHQSVSSVTKYQKKILSRIKNNLFLTDMGKGGFSGRQQFAPATSPLKSYLFIPYAFSLIFPLIDALKLVISRRNPIYWWHFYLTLYTAFWIAYLSILKLLNIPVKIGLYGR